MRLVDEISPALLDCPEVDVDHWPAAFARIGGVVRVDYVTAIHGGADRAFAHVFTSGVEALVPALEDDDEEGLVGVESSYRPIAMGLVDRLIVSCSDGERQALVAYERAGVGDVLREDVAQVLPLGEGLLTWDPENKQLVVTSLDGAPLAVLRGGFLCITPEGMIAG